MGTVSLCGVGFCFFFFQAEDGIRDAQESRGLGDVYKRQALLGDSVAAIATEKAGIVHPGATMVMGQQPPAAAEVLLRRAGGGGAAVARRSSTSAAAGGCCPMTMVAPGCTM